MRKHLKSQLLCRWSSPCPVIVNRAFPVSTPSQVTHEEGTSDKSPFFIVPSALAAIHYVRVGYLITSSHVETIESRSAACN